MAGAAAVVAAVHLTIVLFCGRDGRYATGIVTEINAVIRTRHVAATRYVNLMVAVRLCVLIYVIIRHRTSLLSPASLPALRHEGA